MNQPPRASALRQARVSGGNLQNCAPSAACGGAYAPALFCHWQGRYSGSRLGEGQAVEKPFSTACRTRRRCGLFMKGLRPLHASQELKRDFFDNLTFSRLGEGFYSCAVFMLLGRSIQQSQTDTNDQCTQPRPRGTLIADQRRAGEARPRGKAGSERRKACFHPGGSGFHLPRGWPGPLPV